MWTSTANYGNVDPSFDAAKLADAAGATFVARESVLDPQKLEKMFVAGFSHKGYSFFDVFSNCHINLGRKNKMGEAVLNLAWIESRIVGKNKFDLLSEEERAGKFPTGILKQEEGKLEYCEAYDKVIYAAQNKTTVAL